MTAMVPWQVRNAVAYTPDRIFAGTAQTVAVTGGYTGAQLIWQQSSTCDPNPSFSPLATSSGILNITQNTNSEVCVACDVLSS